MPSDKTMAALKEMTVDSPTSGGLLADDHITVLLVGIGSRLNRGAAVYYRTAWDLGMTEWRLLLVLNKTKSLNVGELSNAADLDKAAVSRSLSLLEKRNLVAIEQTRTRGRAAIARLTPEGLSLCAELLRVSHERQARLFQDFSKTEKEQLKQLLRRLAFALDDVNWEGTADADAEADGKP
jgi:DNA-binding MarR family transcriptional regulator